jgi:hypothetical protein
MRTPIRIIIGGLIAAFALAAAVGVAEARRLAWSENHFLEHYRAYTFSGGGNQIVCDLSLEGSYHSRTFEKINRQLIGYISEARIKRPCSGGEAWVQSTQERGAGEAESLPWHILYERFIGTLPNITGIEETIDDLLVLVVLAGVRCVYRSSTTSPGKGIVNREAGGRATGVRSNETAGIPKAEGSFLCPEPLDLIGTGIVGNQVGYGPITFTLVA